MGGGGAHTHTAYHKGASGRRNVYMMSNDRPKIGLFFRKKKQKKNGMIKDNADKRSQEEESRVVVALSEFS